MSEASASAEAESNGAEERTPPAGSVGYRPDPLRPVSFGNLHVSSPLVPSRSRHAGSRPVAVGVSLNFRPKNVTGLDRT